MDREEALDSIKANVENGNLVKHMLATEAIMRALARRFGEDEEEWGLTGLLHDIDVELTEGDMASHSKLGADKFKEKGFAAGANRQQIALCSEIELELDEFIELGLEAMKGIADDLGL